MKFSSFHAHSLNTYVRTRITYFQKGSQGRIINEIWPVH